MLRFLWFKDINEPNPKVVEFRFCRLVFGLRPSPAILGATINHHLELYEDQHPEMVNTIRSSLYVDDLVSGAQDDDEAFTIYKSARKIMAAGGFNLRKWNSNTTTLVKAINDVEKGAEISATTLKSYMTEEDT